MHRSGTSFLARVLEKSGIFMGVVKDHNFEAMHFLSLNQQILWANQGDWHQPVEPAAATCPKLDSKTLYREHFKINGRLASLKLGFKKPLWGWKDPRNTFTLPCWLQIFPKAKVIYLERDKKQVINSLLQRNGQAGEVRVKELQSAAFAEELTEKYRVKGRSYAYQLGARFIALEYEKLTAADPASVSALSKFCGRDVAPALKVLTR